MRGPPGVSIHARARHAPDLVCLYCGDGWIDALADALHEHERYGASTPTLLLPPGIDPVGYRWPVSGRNVLIYGTLAAWRLKRLLAALLRDGAAVAAGLSTEGQLHTASAANAKAAA